MKTVKPLLTANSKWETSAFQDACLVHISHYTDLYVATEDAELHTALLAYTAPCDRNGRDTGNTPATTAGILGPIPRLHWSIHILSPENPKTNISSVFPTQRLLKQ
jgi:hypothetical protein